MDSVLADTGCVRLGGGGDVVGGGASDGGHANCVERSAYGAYCGFDVRNTTDGTAATA